MADIAEFLTVRQAAEYLGVSRNKIWRLLRDGRLEAYRNPRDDRVKLVRREALEELRQPQKLSAEG